MNNNDAAAKIISDLSGVEENKLLYFLETFGIERVLQNPSIMGVDPMIEKRLSDLKELLDLGSELR